MTQTEYWKQFAIAANNVAEFYTGKRVVDPITAKSDLKKWREFVNQPEPESVNDWPSDEEIHFMGKERYNCDIVPDGETKLRIIQLAGVYREGMKDMRNLLKSKQQGIDWDKLEKKFYKECTYKVTKADKPIIFNEGHRIFNWFKSNISQG